jgi:hypothetical protein
MRALLSKAITGSMVAGAALLVAACGGGEDAGANNAMTDMGNDVMMDGTTNDVTAVDAGTGADANMAVDANMTMDANATNTGNATDANMTNGM